MLERRTGMHDQAPICEWITNKKKCRPVPQIFIDTNHREREYNAMVCDITPRSSIFHHNRFSVFFSTQTRVDVSHSSIVSTKTARTIFFLQKIWGENLYSANLLSQLKMVGPSSYYIRFGEKIC